MLENISLRKLDPFVHKLTYCDLKSFTNVNLQASQGYVERR